VPPDGPADGDAGEITLSEQALVEVLAYLVTAARTQLDEAAEYAPLRLLTAAGRLADTMGDEASAPVQALIAELDTMPGTAVPRGDRTAYVQQVDALCVAVAQCLVALDPPADP
jgi:hypothetical protein